VTTLLIIPGEPATVTAQQKGVNWKSRRFYTKDPIKAESQRIYAHALHQRTKGPPLAGPLDVTIWLIYPLTKALAKKHADRLADDSFTLPHPVRPDVDNLSKLLLDTLTKARIWEDDSQACDLNLRKRYGVIPRIVVEVKPFEQSAAS
jgi:Holliday junction resolvase RusA-like endonuclease